jgi:RNA polymerase sigma-70 factor (ECF subfamily)
MPKPDEPSDEQLFARIENGDETAFLTFYRRHQGGIYRFSLEMSGSAAVAQEVTQEVFLALIRGNLRFDARRGTPASLLFGVARKMVLRSRERDRRYVLEESPPAAPVGDDPLDALAESRAAEAVREAVRSLPPRYRAVVVLCEFQEMSYAEAAAALGCALGTVRSRLNRARALLARKLGDHAPARSREVADQAERCLI